MSAKPIIVVSGLPRSGTSMLMQMLEAGGIPIYSDARRQADVDNPRGYYELARVQELGKDQNQTWLGEAPGQAVKIISPLLQELPNAYTYKVILMNRDLGEVLASQNKMLRRSGRQVDKNLDDKLRVLFEKHLRVIKHWLGRQSNFEVIEIEYLTVIKTPTREATRLDKFLGGALHIKKMAAVADATLYRHRLRQVFVAKT